MSLTEQERLRLGGERSLRVVTWNIEHGREAARAADVIRDHDQLRTADMVLLQEMDEEGTAMIADALGWNYEYASASRHSKTDRDFGNAILSPWPLSDRQVVALPHQARIAGEPRNALKAIVDVDGLQIASYSTHTEIPIMGRAKRGGQTETIGSAASTSGAECIVVGGDFNSASQRSVGDLISRFAGRGFAHASAGAAKTFRRVGRDFTLDHVFAKGLTPLDAGVARGIKVSDHDPVWVSLRSD